MKQSIQSGTEASTDQLNSVIRNTLLPEAKAIFETGVDLAGTTVEEDGIEEAFKEAIKTYNMETSMLSRFPYPSKYAMLGKEMGEPKFSDVSDGIFSDGSIGSDGTGPYTTDGATNTTLEAMFALMANRQGLSASRLNYPLTFFAGSFTGSVEDKEKQGLFADTDMFSRVVLGNLEGVNPYVAIIAFTKAYPRQVYATVWATSSKEGLLTGEDLVKKSAIGNTVVGKWADLSKGLLPELINADTLTNSSESEFVRGSGSTDVHSLLWPLVKLTLTRDEGMLLSDLHTSNVLGTGSDAWPTTGIRGFPTDSTKWHQWTMAILAHGSIPYKKHGEHIEEPGYSRHMKRTELDAFAKAVRIQWGS